MNKEYVLWNLKEAKEELDRTIKEIENEPDYGYGDFVVAMTHLYHHLNTAWNAKGASKAETDQCSQEDFNKWRQFPSDNEIGL